MPPAFRIARGQQRLDDTVGRNRRVHQLDAKRPQRVVDGVGDRGRWRDRAAFADALDAELRIGRRRLHVIEPRRRHFGRTRQQIVRKRRRQRLTGRIERHFLVQRGADTLGQAAIDLAVHDHRIDQNAAVFNDDVVENLDVAEIGIDGDDRGMRGIAEGAGIALRLVARRYFEPARIDIGGQILRAAIPGVRDLLQRRAAVDAAHLAVLQHDRSRIVLQQLGADARGAFAQLAAGGRDRAARHHHRARAPGAGGVRRHRRVAENDAHFGDVDAEHSCATWASVVSMPWPCECTPTRSSSPPSGVRRADACSWPGTIGMPQPA